MSAAGERVKAVCEMVNGPGVRHNSTCSCDVLADFAAREVQRERSRLCAMLRELADTIDAATDPADAVRAVIDALEGGGS